MDNLPQSIRWYTDIFHKLSTLRAKPMNTIIQHIEEVEKEETETAAAMLDNIVLQIEVSLNVTFLQLKCLSEH